MIVYTTTDHRSRRRLDRADDARPLYLIPTGETRIELDGPALSVESAERAAQLFPLRRLSRIYSSERIDWSSEALHACAAHGIGILFVDDAGNINARLLGRPGLRDELPRRFNELMLLPQALDMYQHWLDGMRRRIAYYNAAKAGAPEQARTPRLARQWIERRAVTYTRRQGAERTRQWLRALAFNWMQEHLADLGFGHQNELAQSGEPVLARDLADLLMWYLEPSRIGWLRRRHHAAKQRGEPVRSPSHADTIRLFEARPTRISKRGRDITGSLHRWLIHET